jgi:hypothetical protein
VPLRKSHVWLKLGEADQTAIDLPHKRRDPQTARPEAQLDRLAPSEEGCEGPARGSSATSVARGRFTFWLPGAGIPFQLIGATMRTQSISGLNEEARKAVNGVFDAMAEWRDEVSSTTQACTDKVLDRMGEAAKAAGWPSELVDATRSQFQQASRMQSAFIDQMLMDAWQQQLTSRRVPSGEIGQMPGLDQAPSGMNVAMAPLQMWMQAAELWHKNWQLAFSRWMDLQTNGGSSENERPRENQRRGG